MKKEYIISHDADYDWGSFYDFMSIDGYVVGRVYTVKEQTDTAYIEGLHVSEKERQKHYGSTMIKALINKCRSLGAKKCTLWCDKNSWVYYWYQRLGFKYDGDKTDQDGYVWMTMDL